MAHSTFAERLGYALWIAHLRTGATPTFTAIASAVNRTQPAVSAWMNASEPPIDWKIHEPLATFLVMPEAWLIKEQGTPPRPHLWLEWLAERRGDQRPGYMQAADTFDVAIQAPADAAQQKAPAKGARTSGQRKRRTG